MTLPPCLNPWIPVRQQDTGEGPNRVQQDGQSRRLRELGLFSPDDGHLQGLPEQPGPACGEGIQETEPGFVSATWWEGEKQGALP